MPPTVADQLAAVARPTFGGTLPVRIRAWDDSEAGPERLDVPTIEIRTPQALRRLLFRRPELAVAQAYVCGEIEVDGDLLEGFRRVWALVREQGTTGRPSPSTVVAAMRTARSLGVFGTPPPPPSSQARLRGRLNSMLRDKAAIAHHYDLSNDFYALILDSQMAYSCGYWTSDEPGYTVTDAQRDKLDLVCRKLGLRPGMRVLDVGCGWGAFALHAAEHHGVEVVAVTLAEEQRDFVAKQIAERGITNLDLRLQDYREISDGRFDAISSIEMGEHVGERNYPAFATLLHDLLLPQGRVLVQQMSRRTSPGGGAFIEAFIAPDMHMRPVGDTVELLEAAGLEVRDVHALREHYVRTIHAWYATFSAHWDQAVALVGEEVARVWRLYLVGAALAFEEGRMGVDQILATRTVVGDSGMPFVRTW